MVASHLPSIFDAARFRATSSVAVDAVAHAAQRHKIFDISKEDETAPIPYQIGERSHSKTRAITTIFRDRDFDLNSRQATMVKQLWTREMPAGDEISSLNVICFTDDRGFQANSIMSLVPMAAPGVPLTIRLLDAERKSFSIVHRIMTEKPQLSKAVLSSPELKSFHITIDLALGKTDSVAWTVRIIELVAHLKAGNTKHWLDFSIISPNAAATGGKSVQQELSSSTNGPYLSSFREWWDDHCTVLDHGSPEAEKAITLTEGE